MKTKTTFLDKLGEALKEAKKRYKIDVDHEKRPCKYCGKMLKKTKDGVYGVKKVKGIWKEELIYNFYECEHYVKD